ncbi:MAG TPA: L-arabinose isomerase [Candidatus Dormibacteraeota bacterium]|nr:L-arabinose isomerase [Candidatus Dormibacteraeota bacterium]
MTKALHRFDVWFVTGSQQLYGDETLRRVAEDSQQIVAALQAAKAIPVQVTFKPVLTTPEAIRQICLEANAAKGCIGLIAWMHTFSPAKMWIAGLNALQKPLLHLHTQFNRDLPWAEIDMDFMNLNQSAHGDREFGFIETRMRHSRKTVVGFWQDPAVIDRLSTWSRAAAAWDEAHGLRVARFGDNMRHVAVTEGDKVEAHIRLGFSVDGYSVGELAESVRAVPNGAVDVLVEEYEEQYDVSPTLRKSGDRHDALRDAARIEVGLRTFLDIGGFKAFTDTFEDLDGLPQLPGIAVQRLMGDGYGFGAEGDWKTAALVRLMKVMSMGLEGGTSFMEDYTYHLAPHGPKVLGAHMLEVCPSIAGQKPSCEIHPLSIGGKQDPVRLVFTASPGPAVVVGLLDLGGRFRMVANEVDVTAPDESLPKLPVARAVWQPKPDLQTAAEAWLIAGGPHHTGFSAAMGIEPLADFAEIAGIEFLVIDKDTRVSEFKKELRWNQVYYHLAQGL